MENYSIFGSNIENDYLLKLQNNESNIKIDIHNSDHNFTIDYVNSNEIINNYTTLGLQDITKIDENNYIHKSILNNCNVIIKGKYGLDGNNPTEKYFGNLNQNISEKLEIVVKSSRYFFNNYDGIVYEDYHKYSSCNLVINDEILKNYKFYDGELQLEESLSGIFIYLKFDKKHNIIKYKFYEYIDTALVFPHEVIFYQVFDKNAYFINKQIFRTKSDFDRDYIIDNNAYVSDSVLIKIQSVLIQKDDLLNEIDNLIGSEATQRDYVKQINANNNNESNFDLNVAFSGIELYTTNERLINEYDIDMNMNSIQNINTLSLDRLILNNVIYTNVVSTDNVLFTVNEVIKSDSTIRLEIVDTYLSDELGMDSGNLTEMFNNSRIKNIESNLRLNLDKKYIPYVYLRDDNITLKIEYDSNVNIKYLLNLDDLDDNDKLMKHSNGIIYKENKVDNLEITENLNILSNLNVNGNIKINSNILEWDNNIDKFKHSNGKIIQDEVIDMLSYEPNMKGINGSIISFDTNLDAFTLTYSNNDKSYYIRHPFNFILNEGNTATERSVVSIYENSIYSLDDFECNLKIQFLDLIKELNLYISSRFGNSYNKSQDASRDGLSFVELASKPKDIEDSREIKLYYSNNDSINYYFDYYEYEVFEKVLLKEISFYDIEFDDYDNLLKNYYENIISKMDEITDISSIPKIYEYNDKNYLLDFDVIGYDNGWELIQNISFTEEKTLNQYKNKKIISNKKYSRYRIALKEAKNNAHPFIIKDLKFHIEYNKNNKNILYDGDNINYNITNTLSINNSIKWNDYFNADDKIRTKLIINEDQPSIKYFNDRANKTIPYAVCHINENIDNSNLVENHMLKFGLFNIDSELPSVDYTNYNLSKNTPSVYHSLHLMNSNLYYSQSIINNLNDINNSDNYNEFLILTENKLKDNNLKGLASINIPKEYLSNIINHNDSNISNINGLIVNPMVRLCAFNNEKGIKNYMDIGLNNNLTLDNSYRIELPNNSCNINVEEAYYLKPIVDHKDKVIKTEWSTLGNEVFIKNNIYIGNPNNSNILDNYVNFCNIHPTTKENTEEYLTHIRKLIIGYPDDFTSIDKINSNVLTIGGSVYATHDVSTDSDIAYKYNLEKIEDARYKIEQLNGYTFDRNDTNDERRYCGLIAQEIEKVIPEVIIKKHDGKMRVLYNNLAGLFVECFKDLYKEIDKLKKEVYNHKVEQ
tara:strand:+ start:4255 stop:7890 length:3636 start_codon:yes stop_codon:yes gene_type:complete